MQGLHPESWLVAAGRPSRTGEPLNVPLVPASTFFVGDRLEYSRDDGTPTWEALEAVVGGLEGGGAVAFASGMAAIAAVFDEMPTGARVVRGTVRRCERDFRRMALNIQEFLKTIDCYVMGSRTYETAVNFEARGFGWSYGDKPTFVLTSRHLPRTRNSVEFYSGDLARLVNERLKPSFRSIWFAGGGAVSGACLRLGLVDEVRYSIVPVLIGEGIPFFEGLGRDVGLHLVEMKAYRSGMVALRYQVRK